MIICPICSSPAAVHKTKFGDRNSCCGLHSWGNKPLVSPEVHSLRRRFHEVFDSLWKSGKMTRTQAYKKLSEELGLPVSKCHGAAQDDPNTLRDMISLSWKLREQ